MISTTDETPGSEREHTDESLRVEREKVDDALEGKRNGVDETADAVISRARARADAVLAAARAKTDRQAAAPVPSRKVERDRVHEDDALRRERATADQAVREERAEHVALLESEREGTDRDLLSERARADHALATRDEFLGIVSHDLLNMLNTMVGFAALIQQAASRERGESQVIAHAQRIQRSGGRMQRLIGDLVDVASIEAGTLAVTCEPGDPGQVVTEAVDTFQAKAAASGISLVSRIEPGLSPAAFDAARILQVLTNLLSNALKFTAAGGTVTVQVSQVGDEICFAVSDTGLGIPEDMLEAIFERFLQVTKNDRRGVGLGLYISRSIVLGHGGRIWAESRPGEGSTFFFTLPAA